MEENKNPSEKIMDTVGNLVQTYRDLMAIKAVEKASQGASVSIFGILMLLVTVFILFFLGFGSAWWMGEELENMKAGFFIVGGIFITLLAIILMIAKKTLIPGIRNLLIKKFYEQD
jgi:hypothetical protein